MLAGCQQKQVSAKPAKQYRRALLNSLICIVIGQYRHGIYAVVPGIQEDNIAKRILTFKGLLFSVVFGLLLLLLSGMLVVNLWLKRVYLDEQLLVVSQDAASSLGLSLSLAADQDDWIAASSMVDAIFDSGAYLSIRLDKPEGGVILSRDASLIIDGVPSWFVSILPLSTPAGHAEVMSGWRQVAVLTVISHPGFAYRDLWRTVKWKFGWFAGIVVVTFVLLHLLLAELLKSLRNLTRSAKKIQHRDFSVRMPMPATYELQQVALASNHMAETLQQCFDDQLKTIEVLRQQALVDDLTLLMNRQAFERRLSACLADEHEAHGLLLLADLPFLGDLNLRSGRAEGDRLLKAIAGLLADAVVRQRPGFAGRLSARSFAVYVPGLDHDQAEKMADGLADQLSGLSYLQANPEFIPCLGLVLTAGQDSVGKLLSAVDFAASKGQAGRKNPWYWYSEDERSDVPVRTASAWQSLLSSAISNDSFKLFDQPVRDRQRKGMILQQILVRLQDQGRCMPAGEFIPMVERFGLALELDVLVAGKALKRLASHPDEDDLAITLAAASLNDIEMPVRFKALLMNYQKECQRLFFVVPQWVVKNCRAGFAQLEQLRTQFGFRIVVSRLGMTEYCLKLVRDIRLDAIQLDPALALGIKEHKERWYYLRSIVQIAHSHGTKVIATGVETKLEWDVLVELGVDGIMGFYVAHPQSNPVHV